MWTLTVHRSCITKWCDDLHFSSIVFNFATSYYDPFLVCLFVCLSEATGSPQPSTAGVGEAADISHTEQIPTQLMPPPTPAPKRISFHKPNSIEEEEGELEDETGGEQTVAQDQIQLLTKDVSNALFKKLD